MASENAVVMSAANLNVIEDAVTSLANNLGQVSYGMVEVDTKITDVTQSVKTIEEEIKNFMLEIRGTTISSNAKQSIMLSQSELEKKYGHYDILRRKVSGLLQAGDISAVTKETVQKISEETIVATPNYWLAPAFVALGAWMTDDKDLAERSLKEALNRDDEKTSLLFSLIHARAGRAQTANLWLHRYLEMQDPAAMESKIIVVLDAISNGIFGIEAKETIVRKLEQWLKELVVEDKYRKPEIERIKNHLSKFKEPITEKYQFIENFTDDYENLKASLSTNKAKTAVFAHIQETFSKPKLIQSKKVKIDEIINSLVFDYETNELNLRKDIEKNKLIVEENGNITKANVRFEETKIAFEETNNLFALLTNVCLDLIETGQETKKLAFALIKDLYVTAYRETFEDTIKINNKITINLDNTVLFTTDGQNEKEMFNNLEAQIMEQQKNAMLKVPLFDLKMLISTILGILAIFFTMNIKLLAFGVFIIILVFNAYNIFGAYKTRKSIEKEHSQKKLDNGMLLINTIAEIVDYKLICSKGQKDDEQIFSYLNNLNYQDYITSEVKRNIMIGGNNE